MKGGVPGNPILYRPLQDGTVNFTQIRILTDDVWLDGFNVMNGGVAGYFDFPDQIQERVALTRLTVRKANHAVNAYGKDWFVADCVLEGKGSTGEGIEFRGRGHIAAFNDISEVDDGVSYGEGNIDIHKPPSKRNKHQRLFKKHIVLEDSAFKYLARKVGL